MKRRYYFDLIAMLCCLAFFSIQAQDANSEKDIADKAKRFFDKKEFSKAEPLYSQLLSNHPENILYEYYFGVCQLYSANKKAEAMHHLFQASTSPKVPQDIYYYLGRAYHVNNKFDDAVLAYREFEKHASKAQVKELEIGLQESMCQSGLKIQANGMRSLILDQSQVSMDNFFTQYNFTTKLGKFVTTPENYKTAEDKTAGSNRFIYLLSGAKSFYFSGIPKGAKNIELFRVDKTTTGDWGKASALDMRLNTAYDEAYPTTSEDGKIIYFSSRGPGSMGGYDIFRSSYNEQTKSWSEPENMGIPVNSTDDDFYFVPSSKDKAAWFCSTRESAEGTVKVIKVKFSESENGIHIKGVFYCIDQKQLRSARITVYNPVDNSILAEIKSDNSTGSYELNLPNLKEYLFNVDLDGYAVHSETVNFNDKPEGISELNQEINIKKDNSGNEEFSIINIYPDKIREQVQPLAATTETKAEQKPDSVDKKNSAETKQDETKQPTAVSDPVVVTTTVKNESVETENKPANIVADVNSNSKAVASPSPKETALAEKSISTLSSLSTKNEEIKPDKRTEVKPALPTTPEAKQSSTLALNDKSLFSENQYIENNESKIVFKIQLGIFITKSAKEIIEKYKSKGITNISYRTDESGFNYFYLGNEKDYATAQVIKNDLITKGIEGVFVVAFRNNKQVPIPEAINLSSR